ncbi:hypothetical protein SCHPADRAFT_840955 [Schizopora paradoxa]|uniref:DEAD/DEAH-box helicase domain-containing protein n=1 Tax=Schizopora paradoxa TaxID=27342 RepID=A0A0H2R3V6_9AGAM|nr:hypothetical protein SCHPADRAFT_840955 [Schizopora paradoxa]
MEDPATTMILGSMRRLYQNQDMEFTCSAQKNLLKNALDPNEDIIAVMPTGSGKSMIMELPPFAWDEGFLTIAVIPFKALLTQQLEKCLARGINCAHWIGTSVTANKEFSLLFVSVETAVSRTFKQ